MTRTRCKLRSSSIILVRLSLLFCFFLVFVVADGDGYGGTNSREAAGSGSAAAAGIRFLTENKNKDDVIKLNSGLQYKILNTNSNSNPNTKQHQQAGRPVRRSVHPTLTSRCVCHYEGRLIDGTIFDASYKRVGRFKAGTPAIFAPNQVIPGWTEALQLMVEGDEVIINYILLYLYIYNTIFLDVCCYCKYCFSTNVVCVCVCVCVWCCYCLLCLSFSNLITTRLVKFMYIFSSLSFFCVLFTTT